MSLDSLKLLNAILIDVQDAVRETDGGHRILCSLSEVVFRQDHGLCRGLLELCCIGRIFRCFHDFRIPSGEGVAIFLGRFTRRRLSAVSRLRAALDLYGLKNLAVPVDEGDVELLFCELGVV